MVRLGELNSPWINRFRMVVLPELARPIKTTVPVVSRRSPLPVNLPKRRLRKLVLYFLL